MAQTRHKTKDSDEYKIDDKLFYKRLLVAQTRNKKRESDKKDIAFKQSQLNQAYQKQKKIEEKLNKMTEDEKLEYLGTKANDKAGMWQRKINEKNDSFQKEELRKLWKVMKKKPEKDFTDFKKGIVKQNISLIKEELEDDDFIQKFEKNRKYSGVSRLFKQLEIPASMKTARIRSSGSAVSKENNSSFGQDSVPLSMTQSKIFKWGDKKFYDSEGNYGVTKKELAHQSG